MARTHHANRFSTELTATMSDTALEASVLTTQGSPISPCYLVIDHDVPASAEIILFDGVFDGTTFRTTTLANRYLEGSAATSGLTHAAGAKVISAPLGTSMEDIWDEIDTLKAVPVVEVFTASGTWNKPNNASYVVVEVVGGGGGGGEQNLGESGGGGGGGGGGYARRTFDAAALSSSESVTVGGGGAGSTGLNGGTGGTSSFSTSSSLVSATGGDGGDDTAFSDGGIGGIGSGGDVNVRGGSGAFEGSGGSSVLGGGGTLAAVGGQYGGGAGGRFFENGFDGADGVVIVATYF